MTPSASKWKLLGLLLAATIAILLAFVVRYYLNERVAQAKIDSKPLPAPKTDAPYVVTPEPIVDRMLELAEVKKSDLVYDLGCGDGRIVIAAAKEYGCRAVGFENVPKIAQKARENAAKGGVQDLVSIEEKDIFTCDLSQADVVTLYLLPWMNSKLIPQLEKMKPGARIISHDWDLDDIPPDKTLRLFSEEDGHNHKIHLWIAPLKKPQKKNQ
jgi:SAM-dependent methyltransferase